MAAGKCFPLVRGRVMRATRLDGCGRVDPAACSSIVSDGFVSVAFTANIDEGEEITVTNAAGRTCVRDTPVPTLTGYSLVITFCEVNPDLYAMLTGQSSVFDPNGTAVGFRVNGDTDASKSGFALEIWSNVPGVACTDDPLAQGSFGYLLLPFVQGGVLGDFTIENGAVTFTIQNAATKSGSAWGVGPYNVVEKAGGTSEVQSIAVNGTPTGGTYTLTFNGDTTTALAFNANAAAIQAALEGLDDIASGDVTVTGTGPYVVTFGGRWANQGVTQMSAASSLTGGTNPAVVVSTTTQGSSGGPGPLLEPIQPKDYLHVQLTSIAPPEAGCDCVASGPAATGATAGSPGTWTPVNSYPPETLAQLQAGSITASPATAWTTGQYVILGNETLAKWNGTAWIAA